MTSNLPGGPWSVIATNLPGDGNFQQWIDAPGEPSEGTRFYRLRVQ
jgi:hypothetical protein